MHQLPRAAPRSASAANNPATNPERTNNSRQQPPLRAPSGIDHTSYTERPGTAEGVGYERARTGDSTQATQEKDAKTLNQIIQNFHSKAALLICSARASLPQTNDRNGDLKQNRWFSIVVADTDLLADQLRDWRQAEFASHRPGRLIVEVYVDTSQLNHGQALVITDDAGKRWDVSDALASSLDSETPQTRTGGRLCEVVLERWTVSLGDTTGISDTDLKDSLANVYKKGVILFRSLYTYLRMLPAWKLYRRLSRQPGNQQTLKLKFRVRQEDPVTVKSSTSVDRVDSLFTPLCPSQHALDPEDNVARHVFEPVVCALGPLTITLEYRTCANFAAADAESLLSSRFLGLDAYTRTTNQVAGRSLPGVRTQASSGPQSPFGSLAAAAAAGTSISKPTQRQPRALLGAYGSLSTFHAPEKRASPVTELRQRAIYNDSDEEESSNVMANRNSGNERPRASLDLYRNPPFKAGSLASVSTSPRPQTSPRVPYSPSASNSSHNASSQASGSLWSSATPNRAMPDPTPRTHIPSKPITSNANMDVPRPSPKKYSSSFSDRRSRQVPANATTSARNLSVGTTGAESSSGPDESRSSSQGGADLELQRYIKELESVGEKRRSVTNASDNLHRSTRSIVVDLGQYTKYRDGNAALPQEAFKSVAAGASKASPTTPPSRRLSNVPGLSISSSPSRPLPHMPAVRSRLSTHSVADGSSREAPESPGIEEENEDEEPFIFPMRD